MRVSLRLGNLGNINWIGGNTIKLLGKKSDRLVNGHIS